MVQERHRSDAKAETNRITYVAPAFVGFVLRFHVRRYPWWVSMCQSLQRCLFQLKRTQTEPVLLQTRLESTNQILAAAYLEHMGKPAGGAGALRLREVNPPGTLRGKMAAAPLSSGEVWR